MLNLLWKIGRVPLFMLDAEKAHRLTLGSIRNFSSISGACLGALSSNPDHNLKTEIAGLQLVSPIGLAVAPTVPAARPPEPSCESQ